MCNTEDSLVNYRNLRTAYRPRDYLQSEGIYLVDPLAEKTNLKKSQPLKLLSVDALKKALRFVVVIVNKYTQCYARLLVSRTIYVSLLLTFGAKN